jgi:hypothetical protein
MDGRMDGWMRTSKILRARGGWLRIGRSVRTVLGRPAGAGTGLVWSGDIDRERFRGKGRGRGRGIVNGSWERGRVRVGSVSLPRHVFACRQKQADGLAIWNCITGKGSDTYTTYTVHVGTQLEGRNPNPGIKLFREWGCHMACLSCALVWHVLCACLETEEEGCGGDTCTYIEVFVAVVDQRDGGRDSLHTGQADRHRQTGTQG